MDQVKEAFSKVKEDITEVKDELLGAREELGVLRKGLIETRESFVSMCGILNQLQNTQDKIVDKLEIINQKQEISIKEKTQEIYENSLKTDQNTSTDKQTDTSTLRHINSTTSTHSSTDKPSFKPLSNQNMPISIGNGGVSTDKQTDKQTDTSTPILIEKQEKSRSDSVQDAVEILDSLDAIKKEIRLKFKRLTEQEMLVFSTLYQLEEQGEVDYKTIAKRLKLTESSIRDYIGRLIKKGIPVDKSKINNKTIQLSVSQNLKKIVSLPTILQLRDI
jgi:predicted transcriptional regulator